jgi:hypothetical protein
MWALLLAAVLADEPGRLLVVEAGAAAVTCLARDAAGEAVDRLGGGGPWTWRPEAGDTVLCSADGREPVEIDMARATPGRPLVLELLPARAVTIDAGWAGADTWIEWRAWSDRGTAVVARQRLAIGDRLVLPAATEKRLLRLHPRGSAPVTVIVPEGAAPVAVRVPPLRPGGELVVHWPAHLYQPAAVAAVGADGKEHAVEAGPVARFRVAMLPPGAYAVAARYRGGVRGLPIRVLVRDGETTEVFPPPQPEPGALAVAVPADICAAKRLPLRLAVHRLAADDSEMDPEPVFEETIARPPCARALEGLAGGAYQVQLEREGAETVSAWRAEVLPGRKAEVGLTPSVRVVGRVAFADDYPAGDLVLRFASGGRTWTARTDPGGAYVAVLGAPGEYVVSVGAAGVEAAAPFTRAFTAGEQRQDLRLGGIRLAVRVARADGGPLREPVEVVVVSPSGRRIVGSHTPAEEEVAEFKGLDPGEYSVTARTGSGLTSQGAVVVRLTPQAPQAEAAVVLGRHQGRLRVRDEQGQPVRQAAVTGGGRALVPDAGGTFSLDEVALGDRLSVRAEGFAPVCRILQAGDLPEATLTLVPAAEELTLHAPPQLAWESALLHGLPGSDCPVEIHDVSASLQLGSEGTALALRLPRGRFEIVLGSRRIPVVAPGADVTLTSR